MRRTTPHTGTNDGPKLPYPCWKYPNGLCPYTADQCRYVHLGVSGSPEAVDAARVSRQAVDIARQSTTRRVQNGARARSHSAPRVSFSHSQTLVHTDPSQSMQRTTGPPDAPTANDGPLNFDTTASSGRWKPDQISSITGIHDAHITIAGCDLEALLYRRFAALVSYGAQLIKSKLDDLTTCFDQWALSPDPTNNSRFVPQKQNAPYRRYLCPETACSARTQLSKVWPSTAARRNIVYVDDEDRFTLPNFSRAP
jgi:hypothetical protein